MHHFVTALLFTNFIPLIISSALPAPFQYKQLDPRGGSANSHTCDKNAGSGFACNEQTSISNCNGAVDQVCKSVMNASVATVHNFCYSADYNDCHAAICLPIGWQKYQYSLCTAGFQDIMADCIDPSGAGFKQNRQGGSRNVHLDDTLIGSQIDSKQPSWAIGAKKCFESGAHSLVFSPTGGAAVAEP
ncbi:MAG: hypothetical protein Q9191_000146 [Dirinaria sp. TL-2023a]